MTATAEVLSFILPLLLALPVLSTIYRNTFTSRRALNELPGPFWARFSNLWRFFMVQRGRAELEVIDLHKRYGKVVRLGPNCVSVADVSMIKQIYKTKGVLVKSDMYSAGDFIQGGKRYDTLFSTRDEAKHSAMFRPIARLYALSNVVAHENLIDSTLVKFMEELDKRFVKTGEICELDKWLQYLVWDVQGELTFSERFGFLEQGADVMDLIKTNNAIMDFWAWTLSIPVLDSLTDKNPVVRIGPPSATAAAQFAASRFFKRMAEINGSEGEKQRDFLDSFLALKKENPNLDDSLLISYVMINIIAGSDTTAIGLITVVYYVLKNKSVHQTLRKELDDAKLEVPVSWNKTQTLPYLEAVIREACRIHPPVGMVLERIVPEEGLALPDGKHLPPGVKVGVNPWVTARDQEVFGKDADKYNPDRWLQQPKEPQEAYEARLLAMKSIDMTFGYGKRACYGKYIGTAQLYKEIATLFSVYDLTLAYPKKEWSTKNNFFVGQTGVEVRVARRHA